MTSREYIVELISELAPDDLDALAEYLDPLRAAGDDQFLRAMVWASLRTPEALTPEEEASIDAARADPKFSPHDEVKQRLLGEPL
jgi:hypothetical protein